MELHQARVIMELEQLDDRVEKLFHFRQGERYHLLPQQEQELLTSQLNVMEELARILAARLQLWGLK